MKNPLVHAAENNESSQNHLKQQENKFQGDCVVVLQMLYSGKRLTAKQLLKEYDIDGRRLRDVFTALPNVVKKEWVYDASGKKTRFVEYYIEVSKPPTKEEIVGMWKKIIQLKKIHNGHN